jgi:ABC-type transporter Mla MlaB component
MTPVRVGRPFGTITLVISRPVARAGIPGLCERVRLLLEGSDADLVVCDVGALVDPDAATIDALARLQLTALRLGRQVRLLHACGDLKDLLALTGLSEVVPCADSPLETRGQAKQREPAPGIEEEGDPADPIA